MTSTVLRAITWIAARKQDEEGQGLVEYGLILALVGLACVLALGVLSDGISGLLSDVASALSV
jgi:Flp pilus assembly pilin Flp